MILQVATSRSKEKQAMAVPNSVDAAAWLAEQIQQQDPDLLRSMVKTMAEAPVSAEADTMCGAAYGERSSERANRRRRLPDPGLRHPRRHRGAGHPQAAFGQLLPGLAAAAPPPAEQALIGVVATSYLLGVSTRRVDKLIV
jgi:putative transposase